MSAMVDFLMVERNPNQIKSRFPLFWFRALRQQGTSGPVLGCCFSGHLMHIIASPSVFKNAGKSTKNPINWFLIPYCQEYFITLPKPSMKFGNVLIFMPMIMPLPQTGKSNHSPCGPQSPLNPSADLPHTVPIIFFNAHITNLKQKMMAAVGGPEPSNCRPLPGQMIRW